MRALTGDWLLDDYFWCIGLNHMLAYTPADVYAGTYGGAVAQLDAGVTCTVDFTHCVNTPEHADAGVQAIIDAGGRAVWCYGFWSPAPETPAFTSVEERFADARRIASTYFPTDDGRVTFGVSPTETFRASYEQIKNEFLVGKETGGLVHPHTNTRWRPGVRSDIEVRHEQGILWEHQLHAHCNTSTSRDFELLAASGGSVSATPDTELAMGMGPNIVASADRAASTWVWAPTSKRTLARQLDVDEVGPTNLPRECHPPGPRPSSAERAKQDLSANRGRTASPDAR